MESPMKLSKLVEDQDPVNGNAVDRISSLPDELLGHMLSFLPTTCAVRTSILSTRWRYLFTLTTSLSFEDAPCECDSEGDEEKIKFKKFVHKVLQLHRISPIKKFSLVCQGGPYDESDLNEWVGNAVQKGVQELHYEVIDRDFLPVDLFMCETLVRLKIICYGGYGIEIPLSAWLPRLKVLHLESVTFFNDDSVERLFSSCKLLEELTLHSCAKVFDCQSGHVIICTELLKVLTIEHCTFNGLFEIDAPNLAYLTYSSNSHVKIVPSWKYSCSFVKAELMFCHIEECDYNYDSLQYHRGLLKAAAFKATVLRLLSNSVELLLAQSDHEQMPVFHNLSRLCLGYCPYDSWKHVTSLLDKSPQLESIEFEEGLHRCNSDPVSPPDVPLIPFSCHVNEIWVRNFCGHEGSLLLLGHLLRNAGALKKLTVYKRYSFTRNIEEELRISTSLLMLPRASRECFIEFK